MGKHYTAMSMIFVYDLLYYPEKIELEATAVIPNYFSEANNHSFT